MLNIRRRAGGMFIPISVISWETPCPQRRVDLGHDRLALRNLPSVERPEVDWLLAPVSQVEEPRPTAHSVQVNSPSDMNSVEARSAAPARVWSWSLRRP